MQLSRAGTSGSANQANRLFWGPQVDQLLVDEAITTQGSAGPNRWTMGDQLGTIADIATYASGTTSIANHRTYDSFGRLISESNSAVDEVFGYTGRLFDKDTGLQNNWHRWYDPHFGQWLSEDPIGFAAGDANLRRYVSNSVTGEIDPGGLDHAAMNALNQIENKKSPAQKKFEAKIKPSLSRYTSSMSWSGNVYGITNLIVIQKTGDSKEDCAFKANAEALKKFLYELLYPGLFGGSERIRTKIVEIEPDETQAQAVEKIKQAAGDRPCT